MLSLARLNHLSDEEFAIALGAIYEHSPWVPRALRGHTPFTTRESLRLAMRKAVDDASDDEKLILILAHPDLAGKLAKAGQLTEASSLEQAGLGLDRLTEEEYSIFSEQNRHYRKTFGFPFIICARLTTKQGVLDAFEKRLKNSRREELAEAMRQIHEIARLRLADTVSE